MRAIWWGHVRQGQITPTDCKPIIDRIQAGKLAFLPLHSAHWATPFMEAIMRVLEDVARLFPRNAKSPISRWSMWRPPAGYRRRAIVW